MHSGKFGEVQLQKYISLHMNPILTNDLVSPAVYGKASYNQFPKSHLLILANVILALSRFIRWCCIDIHFHPGWRLWFSLRLSWSVARRRLTMDNGRRWSCTIFQNIRPIRSIRQRHMQHWRITTFHRRRRTFRR